MWVDLTGFTTDSKSNLKKAVSKARKITMARYSTEAAGVSGGGGRKQRPDSNGTSLLLLSICECVFIRLLSYV
jgi:hypothetical protein